MKKNKAVYIILSVLIAFGMWLYVVTVITPEDSTWIYNIPVTYQNEDGLFSDLNLTITEGSTATVNLKFYGKRSELLKLNRTNIEVTVDLNEVTGAGEWNLSYEYELPMNVSPNAVSLQGRSVATITLRAEKLASKTVEVRAVFQGDVASGYMADALETQYDSIDITGPEDAVAAVEYAGVVLSRTNLSQTVTDSLPVTLYDADGNPVVSDELRCSVDRIDVVMTINMIKEVPLTVTLSAGGGASESHAVVDISPQTITLKGDAEQLESLNSINLGTIDLGSIETDYTRTFTIVPPDGTQNLTDTEAEVTVNLVNLKQRTLRVTNIEVANAPEDMSVVLGSSSLQVKLRGGDSVIDTITASDVRAVVDLNLIGTTTGQFNVPVTIYVDGYSDVGAMGTYNILVTISQAVATEEAPVAVSQETSAAVTGESSAANAAGTEAAE